MVREKADAQWENRWSGRRRSKTHIPLFFQLKGLETGGFSACCRDCKTAKKQILQCTGGDVRGQHKSMAWPEALQEWFVPTALVCVCGIYFSHRVCGLLLGQKNI